MFWSIIMALVAVIALLNARPLLDLFARIIQPYFSPLRDLKGPASPSWFYGNLKEMRLRGSFHFQEQWAEEYGPVLRYKGYFNGDRLLMMDPRAIAHVLSHVHDYTKSDQSRYNIGRVLGHGLLFVEGDQHKQQRRIMSPAFGPTQIRALTHIFVDKSLQLCDYWLALIPQDGPGGVPSATSTADLPRATIDVLSWLNKTTLDVIGLAGFNYSFNALSPTQTSNELNDALRSMVGSIGGGVLATLQLMIPMFRIIPTKAGRRFSTAQATFRRIGTQMLATRKAALRTVDQEDSGDNEFGQTGVKGRDLLTLLVKANMATDVKEDARMSDEDVLAQVPTFLIAGHETTSTAVTWALYALAVYPEVQAVLRAALPPPPTEGITMEFLQDLPELDRVVREVMRLHAPVSMTKRIATRADVIPTASEWEDKNGVWRSGVPVAAGDEIVIPILALNRSIEIWGPDAHEFKPDRWKNIPGKAHSIPGIWGNSMAFGGGSRACIGYRFSVIEMKALLYVLVRALKFSLTVPPESVHKRPGLVTRPYIDGKMDQGPQMPLYVSAIRRDED